MANSRLDDKWINFRWRKILHYSLIICILLFQLVIAGYFYNDYVNKKNLGFINKQLEDLQQLEDLTNSSKDDLQKAQQSFQKYIETNNEIYLKDYFKAVDGLSTDLDSINSFQAKNPKFKEILSSKNVDNDRLKKLKVLVDSSRHVVNSPIVKPTPFPNLKPFNYDYDFGKYDIETQTYSDTVVKKGLFGRLKDAISGKVNVKKDSVVVTMKEAQEKKAAKMKSDIDSIMYLVNDYYAKNIQVIHTTADKNVIKTVDNSGRFYATFNSLMVYSNELMRLYDESVKRAKLDLEKELNKQNEKGQLVRNQLIFGLIILVVIVSIILMFFTRLAYLYEARLKAANKEIKEHLNFKNRVLGMLSHEMRSPLKMIDIFLKRIDKKNKDESIKEYLKSINFTNHNLLMQSNQILEYAKNQHVENKLVPVEFNLKEEIDSILNAIQPYIESRNNQFITSVQVPKDLLVVGDNIKMNQVFINILANANKFTENGSIHVDVKLNEEADGKLQLVSKIKDSGAGISQEDLKKIFEPYYQGVISKDVDNVGAGLGLNLCKEIVELFDGTISADSELGKGTEVTFVIYLNKTI